MKRIMILLSGVLLFLLLALLALPFLVDLNNYREEIGQLVKKSTGRELTLAGPLDLTIFPSIGIQASQVTLANSAGFDAHPMASIASLQVRVKLAPLFDRTLVADRVVVEGLELSLARDGQGRNNWDDLLRQDDAAAASTPAGQASGPTAMRGLLISGLSVRNSLVRWQDQQTQTEALVKDLELETGTLTLGQPVDWRLKGHVALDQRQARLDLEGQVGLDESRSLVTVTGLRVDALLQGEGLPADGVDLTWRGAGSVDLAAGTMDWPEFRLSGFKNGFSWSGRLAGRRLLTGEPRMEGSTLLEIKDLRGILTALGHPLPANLAPAALRTLTLNTPWQATGSQVELANLSLRTEPLELQGRVMVKDVMDIRGELRGGDLDLDKILLPPAEDKRQSPATGKTAPSRHTWSLPALALQGQVRLASLTHRGVRLTNPEVGIQLAGGRLRLEPVAFQLEDKAVRLTLDATPPRWQATVQSDPLPLRTLLKKWNLPVPETTHPKALSSLAGSMLLEGDRQTVTVRRLDLKLDDMTLQGSAGYDGSRDRGITLDMRVDRLNLDHYLPPEDDQEPANSADKAPDDDARQGVLPVKLLRTWDVDGQLKVADLVVRGVAMEDFALRMQGEDGLYQLASLQGKVYKGTFQAKGTLDVRDKQPRIQGQSTLRRIQIGPLVRQMLDKEVITGAADVDSQLTTTGNTRRQFKKNLAGTTRIAVNNGSIQGVDVIYQIQSAYNQLRGKQPLMPPEMNKTDFAELGGSFQIDKGVIRNEDLKMLAKAVTLTGSGLVADLPRDRIDYLVKVNLLTAVGGLDNATVNELKGIQIPVRLHGKLSKPDYGVALDELLRSAVKGKAVEKVNQVLDKKLAPRDKEKIQDMLKQLR